MGNWDYGRFVAMGVALLPSVYSQVWDWAPMVALTRRRHQTLWPT